MYTIGNCQNFGITYVLDSYCLVIRNGGMMSGELAIELVYIGVCYAVFYMRCVLAQNFGLCRTNGCLGGKLFRRANK